jgi:hypothetical protein
MWTSSGTGSSSCRWVGLGENLSRVYCLTGEIVRLWCVVCHTTCHTSVALSVAPLTRSALLTWCSVCYTTVDVCVLCSPLYTTDDILVVCSLPYADKQLPLCCTQTYHVLCSVTAPINPV